MAKAAKRLQVNEALLRVVAPFVGEKVNVDASAEAEKTLKSVYTPKCSVNIQRANKLCTPEFDLQIVVPAYNVESYIEQCIDSILEQQTKYSYKIYIVNDGSKDGTAARLDKYRDNAKVVIINQENQGLSEARNTGFKEIRGKYIMFVDSDDYLMPDAIESLMNRITDGDDELVQGGYVEYYDNPKQYDETLRGVKKEMLHSNDWVYNIPGFAWGKVFKSELFANLVFPKGFWYEDTIMGLSIFPRLKSFSTIAVPVYCYRKRQGSITAVQAQVRTLETWWVTIGLIDSWKTMGVKEDNRLYDFMLEQLRCNYERVHLLQNESVDKAMFVLTCRMMREHFPDMTTSLAKYSLLEKAINTCDYGLYKWCCRLVSLN